MNDPIRVLIVDDDQRMTRTLADILRLSGYAVVEAVCGPQALECVRAQPFDCVLTDMRMPDMDGLELHRRLRQARPGLPVVLMTAYAADEVVRQGLDEGVVGVFNKPLNISLVLDFFAALSKSRTIAIVDDDPIFCRTLAEILRQRCFNVAQITDPHIDVDSVAADAQTILLDLKLNSVSGFDLLLHLRERYPSLPVLLITGYREEMAEVIRSALAINAYACLYKPLEIPTLLDQLSQLQLRRLRGAFRSR